MSIALLSNGQGEIHSPEREPVRQAPAIGDLSNAPAVVRGEGHVPGRSAPMCRRGPPDLAGDRRRCRRRAAPDAVGVGLRFTGAVALERGRTGGARRPDGRQNAAPVAAAPSAAPSIRSPMLASASSIGGQPARLHQSAAARSPGEAAAVTRTADPGTGRAELQIARQILFGKLAAISAQAARCSAAEAGDQPGFAAGDSRHQQVAEVAGQLAAEVLQVVPVALEFVHDFQHPAGIALPRAPRSPACRASSEKAPSSARTSAACSCTRSRRWPGRAPKANPARCLRRPAPAAPATSGPPRSPSCWQIQRMRSISSSKSTERKLKCWQRDAMVAGILCASVVHSTNTTHGAALRWSSAAR